MYISQQVLLTLHLTITMRRIKGKTRISHPIMTIRDQLVGLGFGANEADVYLASLELGEPQVGAIEKRTGLHKQLIYNAAASLERKGLMSVHEIRGRKRFSVENPGAIEEYAQERLRKAQGVVAQLFEHANQDRAADRVRTYQGAKGVQQYYIDAIRRQPEKSRVRVLGVDSERYFGIFPKEGPAYRRFEALRTERAVRLDLLLFSDAEKEAMLNARRPAVGIRVLDDALQAPMDVMVWHDHVGMLFYGDDPYVLDVIGQDTVRGFGEYLEALWKRARKA